MVDVYGLQSTMDPGIGGATAGNSTPGGGWLSSAGQWLSNPNNQKLLAGLAAIIDRSPQGAAETNLATGAVESVAAQKQAGAQNQRNTDWNRGIQGVLQALSHPNIAGAQQKPDGSVAVTLQPSGTPAQVQGATPEPARTNAQTQTAPSAPAAPAGPSPSASLGQLLPFLVGSSGPTADDLRGLTPQQVAQAQQSFHGDQAAQQTAAHTVLSALAMPSAEAAQDAETAYRREATRLAGPESQSRIEHSQALVSALKAALPYAGVKEHAQILNYLSGIERDEVLRQKAREDMKDTSDVRLRNAQAGALEQKTQQEKALGNLPYQELEAKIAHYKRLDTTVPVVVKNEKGELETLQVPVSDFMKERLKRIEAAQGGGGGLTPGQQEQKAQHEQTRQDKLQEREKEAETTILRKTDTGENITKKEVIPHMDEFNKLSSKPYAYIWSEEKGRGFKVDLPFYTNGPHAGRRMTAKELVEDAASPQHRASPKQYLEFLYNKGVIKEKLPWR